MNQLRFTRTVQVSSAFVAILFGFITVFAGTRVLTGTDPGYLVFKPLLFYNVTMGLAYVAVGVLTWHHVGRGKYAAGVIFILNFLVLGVIYYLYVMGGAVAIDSVRAMVFRTMVWLVLFFGLAWASHQHSKISA